MKLRFILVFIFVSIVGGLTIYMQKETIEEQQQRLAHSLSILSGEIATLRQNAQDKENRYYGILSGLTAPSKPATAMFGCLNEDGVIDKQVEDKVENYDFVADANVFEDVSGAWIRKSDSANCYRSEIVVK